MKKIEAPSLEEAYTQAAQALGCSVTELEVTVIQHPSRGLLGLFAKPAVIVATGPSQRHTPTQEAPKTTPEAAPEPIAPLESKPERVPQTSQPSAPTGQSPAKRAPQRAQTDRLVEAFNEPVVDECTICREIEQKLNALFKNTCYRIEPIEVSMYDEKTVRVFFDGEDAALLIGRDGYRYKALSYILFNWINPRYGYLLRLEIAEFLQNQEEMIARYLEPVIEGIRQNGRGQTRILDGVLVQIALKELRTTFPNKYVAIKSTPDGGKYVLVSDFVRKY